MFNMIHLTPVFFLLCLVVDEIAGKSKCSIAEITFASATSFLGLRLEKPATIMIGVAIYSLVTGNELFSKNLRRLAQLSGRK